MDNMRVAVASIGKLMFAQLSELVCECFNNGLPSNLSGGPNPSLDFGLKRAEIAMAAYCSELLHLANPVTTHVQSAEQHTQDVNSLGLISARKSAEAVEILKHMSATYMIALCQAIDLRHLEEHMTEFIKHVVVQASRKTLYSDDADFCEKELSRVIDHLDVFSYLDDPTNPSYPLMQQLRDVLVQRALRGEEEGHAVFKRIPDFEVEVKKRLEEVAVARERFYDGEFLVGKRIEKCRTYPVYRFVRDDVGTELLRGGKKESPGEYIEKVYEAFGEDKLGEVLIKCLKSFSAGTN